MEYVDILMWFLWNFKICIIGSNVEIFECDIVFIILVKGVLEL